MTSPTHRVIIGLGLASIALGADQGIDRAVRQQESSQKSVAALTTTTAKQMDVLVDEYTFNRLGDESQAQSLSQISQTLAKLADPAQAGKEKNMPWVQNRLVAARSSGDTAGELSKASEGQGEIVAKMDDLLKS